MNKTFLLLGSNLGNRINHLQKARNELAEHIGILINISSIYETSAWGKIDQPDYLNQAVEINSALPAMEILHRIWEIEEKIGRVRKKFWEPRIIDIDILFYNKEIIFNNHLRIPHPHLQDRKFALAPLEEIAPCLIHPIYQLSIHDLLKCCKDPLDIKKIMAKNIDEEN